MPCQMEWIGMDRHPWRGGLLFSGHVIWLCYLAMLSGHFLGPPSRATSLRPALLFHEPAANACSKIVIPISGSADARTPAARHL